MKRLKSGLRTHRKLAIALLCFLLLNIYMITLWILHPGVWDVAPMPYRGWLAVMMMPAVVIMTIDTLIGLLLFVTGPVWLGVALTDNKREAHWR